MTTSEAPIFCADFETNTTEDSIFENPVWLWAFAPMGCKSPQHVHTGNSIESFMHEVAFYASSYHTDIVVYFHNLKFDGNFIIPQLLIDSYEYKTKIPKRLKDREPSTFNVLRSANGAFYTITVVLPNRQMVTYRDSLKIIVGSIKSMPKLFGFEGELGKLPFSEDDYTRIRPHGYEPNEHEIEYCKYDVLVLCRALQELERAGFDFDCLTTGAYAWKSVCDNMQDLTKESTQGQSSTKNTFKSRMFSIDEEEWMFAREAYYGGITVCNPKYQGRLLEQVGRTDDVNSMYPTVMRYYPLPYGKGMHVQGCPIDREPLGKGGHKVRRLNEGTLWIGRLQCHMVLKDNQVPIYTPKCVDPQNPFKRLWSQGERVTDTRQRSKEPIEIVITSVDWDNLNHHYEFLDVEWIEGYVYTSRKDLFANHVDKYTAMKVESKKQGLKGQTYVAKLCLNSAYGKLGQRAYLDELTPFIGSDMKLEWTNKLDIGGSIYKKGRPMHIAAFITSWARWILCNHIRAVGYDRFCYADTDSVHYLGTEAPEGTDIDPTRLGAWDNESIWVRAKFVRPKAYYEVFEDGTNNIKLAGCPNSLLEDVSIEDFDIGLTVHGKKVPVIVPRGVMLETRDYTFSEKPLWGER